MPRRPLRDPVLIFLYKAMKAENATLPEDQRVGFWAYLRRHGILSPERLLAIQAFEQQWEENERESDDS